MLIEFQNVSVRRGGRPVLHDLNISLSEHRIGVIGPNGAGKSTLARLVNGLVTPSEGTVLVGGVDVSRDLQGVRRQVGFLFQNPDNQIVFPVVREDLSFALKALLPAPDQQLSRMTEVLGDLGIGDLLDRSIQTLSGGQKQLVALACVLCMRPACLVLDEPTTQLDLRFRNRLLTILVRLPQPAIVLTHDLDILHDFDRILVIEDGRIVNDGHPATVLPWYRNHCQ